MKKRAGLIILALIFLLLLCLIYWYYQERIGAIDDKLRVTNANILSFRTA